MSELSDSLNDLLYPVPADDRNILEKTLDQLGVDQFTFYAITGSTVIFAAITFIRFHGKGLVERFGVSILFKITFAVLWLLNLPAAYEKALQKETAEWKASQFKGLIFYLFFFHRLFRNSSRVSRPNFNYRSVYQLLLF